MRKTKTLHGNAYLYEAKLKAEEKFFSKEELNKILVRENRMELYNEALKCLKVRVDLDLALIREDVWGR